VVVNDGASQSALLEGSLIVARGPRLPVILKSNLPFRKYTFLRVYPLTIMSRIKDPSR
jgi:hypothetical protein